MLVNFEKKIIFIHIPKTAGSTIGSSLCDWSRICGFSNAHSSVDQIRSNMDTNGFRFVTFVRDPYTRFKSLYNFLIIHGKCHDTPLTFAINIFTGKYGWSFTNPMCYFCKTSDLSEIGRVENFKKDFIKIFGIEPDKSRNKIDRPDIYVQFPQLRHMVSRLYMEDFIEFKYPLDPFIYKQVPVPWTIEDVEKIEKKCSQDDYTSSGSIFDEIPLSKMIT